MIPEDRDCIIAIHPKVKPPYGEHELGVHPCKGKSSGKLQFCLYEKEEDFPEAFITLDREQQKALVDALTRFLNEEGGAA